MPFIVVSKDLLSLIIIYRIYYISLLVLTSLIYNPHPLYIS